MSPRNDESRYATDAARWAALQAREAAADGAFWVAVKTTRIYCRPSCKSRQPLRKNVEFHNRAADAVAAGFRACKRCKPDQWRAGTAP
ncbi:MAG: hypothetical protein FJX66_06820 [Alphaproteobacteria bacterium]|nr:hypothetical protein [Alphaproteobacteria bacterium]